MHILLLSLWFKPQYLTFLFQSVHDPSDTINFSRYVKFASSTTRAKTLKTNSSTILQKVPKSFYLNGVVRLWNSLPSHLIWNYFQTYFKLDNNHIFHFCAPVPIAYYLNSQFIVLSCVFAYRQREREREYILFLFPVLSFFLFLFFHVCC